MTTVLLFLVVISVLIVIHELGHFFAAKAFGVRVEEFAIGFPPRLWSVTRGETRYSINALPLGGYVKLTGEEDPTDPRSLAGRRARVRATIIGAGVVMNFVLTILLFMVFFTFPPSVVDAQVVIGGVNPGSPAAQSGLLPRDVVVMTDAEIKLGDLSSDPVQLDGDDPVIQYDGTPVNTINDVITYTKANLGSEISLLVMRSLDGVERPLIVRMVPRRFPPPEEGPDSHLGVLIGTTGGRIVSNFDPSLGVIPESFKQVYNFITTLGTSIDNIFTTEEGRDGIAGPIGIAQVTGEVARNGVLPLIGFVGILSLHLAIFNILPIPALDGGRMLFLVIEVVRGGKRVPPQREALIHLAGFMFLIALIIIISGNDILRIIRGEDILQ